MKNPITFFSIALLSLTLSVSAQANLGSGLANYLVPQIHLDQNSPAETLIDPSGLPDAVTSRTSFSSLLLTVLVPANGPDATLTTLDSNSNDPGVALCWGVTLSPIGTRQTGLSNKRATYLVEGDLEGDDGLNRCAVLVKFPNGQIKRISFGFHVEG